jgi:hypothetical protein
MPNSSAQRNFYNSYLFYVFKTSRQLVNGDAKKKGLLTTTGFLDTGLPSYLVNKYVVTTSGRSSMH